MDFGRFQRKVQDVMALANRSNYPVDDKAIISAIIGNMRKSPHTLDLGTSAMELKRNKNLPDFFKFLKPRWENAQLNRQVSEKKTNNVRKNDAQEGEEKKEKEGKKNEAKKIVSHIKINNPEHYDLSSDDEETNPRH